MEAGSLTVGSTLKLKNHGVVAGRLPSPVDKFQWYARTAKIAHATKDRLQLKAELVGKRIAVEVRAITSHEKLTKTIVAGKVKW